MAKLKEYKKKRNFKATPEPKGKVKKSTGLPKFVIQQHAATADHFDFRLEIHGTLKSWAVPKGPSMNPSVKRLAIETEDHPLEYANFEGIIPKGEYGGGEVLIWDKGTFVNEKEDISLEQSYKNGEITVYLKGKKIKGGYALVRMGKPAKKVQWLLIKKRDEEADARRNPTKTQTKSVISGKTIKDLEKRSKRSKKNPSKK